MFLITQVQEIRNNLSRLLGKVKVTDGTNDMPSMDAAVRAGYQHHLEMPLASRIDWASSTLCYVGWAAPGTSESAASWRIKKILFSGDDVSTTWADGDSDYDNTWDNRASISYS